MLHLYVIQRAPKISETMSVAWSQEYHALEILKRRPPHFVLVWLPFSQVIRRVSWHHAILKDPLSVLVWLLI